MNTVISVLLTFVFNNSNQDIYYFLAVYILDHLEEVEKVSIAELATRTHTSVTSIKNFCELLGFETFKKMKKTLYSTRQGRVEQIKYRCSKFNEDSLLNQIEYLSDKSIDKALLLEESIKVVNLIKNSKRVYLIGAVYPMALSLNFVEDLRCFNKNVYIQHINHGKCSYEYNQDDLVIFISVTGRFLSHNRQFFLEVLESDGKKVIISQNDRFRFFDEINAFVKLYREDDAEEQNLILIQILNLIKLVYLKDINKI